MRNVLLFVNFALNIRSGSRATHEAPIYSIAVIQSFLPLSFLNALVSPLLIDTSKGEVVSGAKPVSSTLKIASEG
jgi:hypothetical protein